MQAKAAARRWFSFSLRTLFVAVTVGCVWIGWQANIVHQRRVSRMELETDGIIVTLSSEQTPAFWSSERRSYVVAVPEPEPVDGVRRLLGDVTVKAIIAKRRAFTDYRREEIKSLFPEAKIYADAELVADAATL